MTVSLNCTKLDSRYVLEESPLLAKLHVLSDPGLQIFLHGTYPVLSATFCNSFILQIIFFKDLDCGLINILHGLHFRGVAKKVVALLGESFSVVLNLALN